MADFRTCVDYMKKARSYYFITNKIVKTNENLEKQIDTLNAFFMNDGVHGVNSDKVVFFESFMEEKYGKFLRATVTHFLSLHKAKDLDKISNISYLIDYFMNTFDFSYQFVVQNDFESCTREIGLNNADSKELFIRRNLDMFPFHIKDSCTENEVRMMYYYFVVLFCYDYCVTCCESFVKLLDKGSTLNLSDILECIVANERSQVQIPVDYVFLSDKKNDYCHLMFRSLGTLRNGAFDYAKNNVSKE